MTRLDQMPQPVAVERHHAGFGDGEKAGEDDEDEEREQQGVKRYIVQGESPVRDEHQFSIESASGLVKKAPQRFRTTSSTNLLPMYASTSAKKPASVQLSAVRPRQPAI